LQILVLRLVRGGQRSSRFAPPRRSCGCAMCVAVRASLHRPADLRCPGSRSACRHRAASPRAGAEGVDAAGWRPCSDMVARRLVIA
jgi:hypothetical protein